MKYQKLICTNIKKLRLKHDLTQEEFAEKIGLTINGVSNIERNKYQPTAETVDKICNAFDITPIELLSLKTNTNEEVLTDIIALLSQCPLQKLKKIYDIVLIMMK